MSCGNLTFKHCLLLFIFLSSGVPSFTSSTDCNCTDKAQNARCLKVEGTCRWVCAKGYWGTHCQFGRLRVTKKKGYITDGLASYKSFSKRMWLIEAENSLNASIHFEVDELSTECNWDHLYIFDGGSIYSTQLAAFSGYVIGEANSSFSIIPQELVAKSGRAYIYFYSDMSVEKVGFNISYSIVENCHCSRNGRCNAAGLCSCNPGWSGAVCGVEIVKCTNCTNGVCNKTLGQCVCYDGFTGEDCAQPVASSYWARINVGHSDDLVSPRASHSSAIIGDWMWVYNGYTSHGGEQRQHFFKYNLKDNRWEKATESDGTPYRWGHTMIAYKSNLIVFGGENTENKIGNDLAIFHTNSTTGWTYPPLLPEPVAVTGHTATLVGDTMIVIFGLSTDGLFPNVQEYDIVNVKWNVIESDSAIATARYGHTSVYDSLSGMIYVYGGMTLPGEHPKATDSLDAYDPAIRKWVSLGKSGLKQALHSAVVLDGMMLVYGGKPYIVDSTCHSSKLLLFDFACQKWKSSELPQLPRRLARYGHTAVAKGRTMYIFGGFNGALFNDVLTYTHGDCSMIFNEAECLEKYFSAGCHWTNGNCVNRGSQDSLTMCPLKYQKHCNESATCAECSTSPRNCSWSGSACQVGADKRCPAQLKDRCTYYDNCKSCLAYGCLWKNNACKKTMGVVSSTCSKSCAQRLESSTCLKEGVSCIWCENLQRCIDSRLYIVFYPYGQCLEWVTNKIKDRAVACTSKTNCQDCYTLPGCGWCEEGSKPTGVGHCLKGGVTGPRERWKCKFWNFIDCPSCQCNGHSNCSVNSSVCLACADNTIGKNCEKCAAGYFGNPGNGAMCRPCQCNGHSDTCDDSSGKCHCVMKGALGDNCERCSASSYEGNATNGGVCYYKLTSDFLYRINVSDKTIFNFICSPKKADQDTVVTVEVIKKFTTININDSFPAKLNVSVGSDVKTEVYWVTNVPLTSKFQQTFSNDDFDFASDNFHFKIYVYDIEPYSSVSVSVHQPGDRGIDLLHFFIIFLACFIGLLILAVIFWKSKATYDAFRLTRRRNVELVYMTNRPFASVPICMEKPGKVPMKNKPSPLTSEICCGNKAAVVTVLIRMPLCAQTTNAAGAGALCLGSALTTYNEHHGSKMMNYMKNVKRRRNPFRSSPA